MDDPIKIIYKYKNNNRRNQYNIYIFIGNVPNNIMSILDKIQNLNFYNTLIKLSDKEINILEKQYGTHWYKKFFNTYHINHIINNIKNSSSNKHEIKKNSVMSGIKLISLDITSLLKTFIIVTKR